ISFPDAEMMQQIVAKHYPTINDKVVEVALNIFYQLRNVGLDRAPTTRELLNWLKYAQTFTSEQAIEKIKNLEGLGVLVKTQPDMEKLKKAVTGTSTLNVKARSNYFG
ncbi:MAG: hypothetical protein NWP83_04505, partial [Spirosomaceae bacterium]|nr:hypothetical protein [Spirosomataceae bacterium]